MPAKTASSGYENEESVRAQMFKKIREMWAIHLKKDYIVIKLIKFKTIPARCQVFYH